jgi:hypothetical protein
MACAGCSPGRGGVGAARGTSVRDRSHPPKWTGLLRRSLTAAAIAGAIAGSKAVEGVQVSQPDAEAAVAGEEPTETDAGTWSDVLGYRDATNTVVYTGSDAAAVPAAHDRTHRLAQ